MRYDKYDPISGGTRGVLAADLAKNGGVNQNGIGVGVNSSGLIVPGAGNTGVIGVLVVTRDMKAGDTVDVMSHGDCVEATSALTAGTVITADTTTGALGVTAASATKTPIGYMMEAGRLVVRRGVQPYIGT